MMKFSWCFLVLGLVFSGCLKSNKGCPYKESNTVAPQSEQQQVEAYLSANGITTAVKHSSGMYYEILAPGSGAAPQLCSSISVSYSGKLTNGTPFDQSNLVTFDLGRVIVGWQKALPLIKKGGHIKMYIPPSLGYGAYDIKNNAGVVVIPANSILIFDVEMFDVN